jgi:hypothetical protein
MHLEFQGLWTIRIWSAVWTRIVQFQEGNRRQGRTLVHLHDTKMGDSGHIRCGRGRNLIPHRP